MATPQSTGTNAKKTLKKAKKTKIKKTTPKGKGVKKSER
jgi:hypothetical protein